MRMGQGRVCGGHCAGASAPKPLFPEGKPQGPGAGVRGPIEPSLSDFLRHKVCGWRDCAGASAPNPLFPEGKPQRSGAV